MSAQPNPANPQVNIDLRMRTLRTLWLALMLSVVFYYVFTLFKGPSEELTPNKTLSIAFVGVGLLTILISFLIKSKLISRAIDQQQVPMVQQAYIVAWAMAEVPALLGMLDYFLTGNPYYYLLMIIAIAGKLLHYPRREHVESAGFKGSRF